MIALIDCNSFYCSCERLFRPDLARRPVGVLSNNDGCFVSLTPELKALGVPMGSPYFQYKNVCEKNKVAVFSANFSLYTNLSDRVMKTLSPLAPVHEIYSIDESFMDLSGISNLLDHGKIIRAKILRDVGIPVSVGIAPTKTLAKVANHIAKSDPSLGGVLVIKNQNDIDQALTRTTVGKLWGVGKQSEIKLRILGIQNAKQFRDFKNEKIIQSILTKTGRQIQDELKGIICKPISNQIEKKKEIMSSRTFGRPVYDKRYLCESVANYTSLAAEKLRKQNSVCQIIQVGFRTNPYKETSQYYAYDSFCFQTHTSDTRKLIQVAMSLVDGLYSYGYEYKKAMVRLTNIIDTNQTQLSLFETPDSALDQILMKTMDNINTKEGYQILKSAACGVDNLAWKMRQELKTPRFLTGWSELFKVY
ncbi:MAG: Y-family DNA polymerase [Bacteriovoracaceae bacterium]|nr:Y-family DNA polymerase [Bacteriovoracaceae bacterium]